MRKLFKQLRNALDRLFRIDRDEGMSEKSALVRIFLGLGIVVTSAVPIIAYTAPPADTAMSIWPFATVLGFLALFFAYPAPLTKIGKSRSAAPIMFRGP